MYGIGVASRLSGVPTETIRIWERRYGLPNPGRSAGGHRIYSDPDVELLKAIRSLVDQGVRVGGLAGLSPDEIVRMAAPAPEAARDTPPESVDFSEMIAEAVALSREMESEKLAALLGRPLLHRHADEVVRSFYLPLMRVVGDLWHDGELSIASEHLIEKQVSGRIHSVIANRGPAPAEAPAVVCACVAGERHEVGLLASAMVLQDAGLRVLYLGADLPADDLVTVVKQVRPRLVLLASYVAMNPDEQNALITALRDEAFRHAMLAIGGLNAADLARDLPMFAQICEDVGTIENLGRQVLRAS